MEPQEFEPGSPKHGSESPPGGVLLTHFRVGFFNGFPDGSWCLSFFFLGVSEWTPDRHSEGGQGNSSVWSSALGVAGTILTLACWKSRKEVFLDRICISQTDGGLKTEAICSLAGILNKSESMLVLWDASFAERLWCVFEIAAFLKSKEHRDRPLVVCPTLTGPVSCAVFATATIAFIPVLVLPERLEGALFPYALTPGPFSQAEELLGALRWKAQ